MRSRLGDYLLAEILGTGAFGKVRRAVHQPTNRQYAIKIMEKALIRNQELTLNVRREIAIMKALSHPNIVSVHNVLTSKTKLYVVLDLVRGPELFEVIAKRGPGGLPEKEARKYFQHLIDGVDYCHRRGVCHRDLKPENLLIDQDGTLRITDFGLSSMKGANTTTDLLTTQCGTPNYIAPEIISCANPRYDGQKVDTWACGIILYALLAGYLPFDETDLAHLFEVIQKGHFEFPRWFSAGAKDLIWRLLCVDPNTRASVHDVKQHPWFLVNYQTSQSPRVNPGTERRRRRRSHAHDSVDETGLDRVSILNEPNRCQPPDSKSAQTKPSPAPPMLSLDIPSLQLPPIQKHDAPQSFAQTPSQTSVAAAETARLEMLRSRRAMSFSKKYSLLRKGVVTYGGTQIGGDSFCGSTTLGGEQQARMRGVLSECNSSIATPQVEQSASADRTDWDKEKERHSQKMRNSGDKDRNEQQDTIHAIQSLRNVISARGSKLTPEDKISLDCGAEDDQRRQSTLEALRKLRDELRGSEPSSSPGREYHFLGHIQRMDTIRLLNVWESRIMNDLRNDEENDDTRVTEQEISAFQSLLQTWETHLGGEDFVEDVFIPGSESVEDESPAITVPDKLFDSFGNYENYSETKPQPKTSMAPKCDEPSSAGLPHNVLQKAPRNNCSAKSDMYSSDDGSDLAKLWNHALITNTSKLDAPQDGPSKANNQDKSPSKDLTEDHLSSPVTDCHPSPSSTRDKDRDVVGVRKGMFGQGRYSGSQNMKISPSENSNVPVPLTSPKAPETPTPHPSRKHRAFSRTEYRENNGDHSQILTPVKSHEFKIEPPLVRSPAQRQIRVDSVSSRQNTHGRAAGATDKLSQTERESRSGSLRAKMEHLKLNDHHTCHFDLFRGVTRRYNFLSIRSKYNAQFVSGLDAKTCLRELGRLMETEGIAVSRKQGQKTLRVRIPGPNGNEGVAASFDFLAKGESGTVVHIKRVGGDRSMSRNEADTILSNFVRKLLARFSDFEPSVTVLPGRTKAVGK